jgi:Tol biopolymer transport system component
LTLSAGTRLGPYEIVAPIGAGGMGEVFKARDSRLERTVAIKVLPTHLTSSPETRQRFEREAKTISQLSHPHICTIYDVGREGETEYLVMEFLEGQTLADRLATGALPLEQTLRYGMEIADALDKAHRQGIVHRDLKPANVMVTKAGVKLLDFGLAKAVASATPSSSLTALPTQQGLTQEGTILGTFQYMAPEQLEGREADARTDIFALGAVLYEMTTGRKAFSGASQASLISSIMRENPAPIAGLAPMTPPALERVVTTCLAKDPEDRWQSAHDVASELGWIARSGSQAGAPAPVVARRKKREGLAWAAAALCALVAVALAALLARRAAAPVLSPLHALIPIPDKADFLTVPVPEISPDGSMVVWSGIDGVTSPLWVRSLSGDGARALTGTEGAMFAFWSPDGRSIGFFADRKLKRIDVAGGALVTLCDIPDFGRGGTWSRDGVIVFSGGRTGPLYRISASGGVAEPVTKLDPARGDTTHRWPYFLPDGRHFLYLASPNVSEKRAVFVAAIDGGENRPLTLAPEASLAASEAGHPVRTEAIANATYASGHVLFVQESRLYARPFDAAAAKVTGPAVVVAENVASGFGVTRSMFSASNTGNLVYVAEPTNFEARADWVDRSGKRSPAVFEPLVATDLRLSPDGKRLAMRLGDPQTHQEDIWVLDLAQGSRTRLTFGPGRSAYPLWSPDGSRVAYVAPRPKLGIYERSATGVGAEKLLFELGGDVEITSWSADGRHLLYSNFDPSQGTGFDIWALQVEPPGKAVAYLRMPGDQMEARFSPDGKYVAYKSDESGRDEVYVQTFPVGGGKWQISRTGGVSPRWRADGRGLFFFGRDGRIYSSSISANGTFEAGAPQPFTENAFPLESFEVAPDGQRLLVTSPVVDPTHLPLRLIAHWSAMRKP